MSMKIEAGDYKKGDLFFLFPQDIVVDESKNPRGPNPHSQEQVEALANSILKNRQQQNCVARRIDGNRVQLVSGYGRWKAVNHINTVIQPSDPIRLMCRVVDCNDEEAFEAALDENLERAETTPVSDAHAQRVLREVYLWEEDRIAQKYKKSVKYLEKLQEVLKLSKPIQAEIANGRIPVEAAVALAKLPEAERVEVVEAARNPESGKVSTKAVAAVAKLPEADRAELIEEATSSGQPIDAGEATKRVRKVRAANDRHVPKRTMKDLRDFLEGLTGPAEKKSCRGLAESLLRFVDGKMTEDDMADVMRE